MTKTTIKQLSGGIVGGLTGYGLRIFLVFYVLQPAYGFRMFSVSGLILAAIGFSAGYVAAGGHRAPRRTSG